MGIWVAASPGHGPSPHTHQGWGQTVPQLWLGQRVGAEAELPNNGGDSAPTQVVSTLRSIKVSPSGCLVGSMRRSRRCTRTPRPRWTIPCWPSASSSASTLTGPTSSTATRPPGTPRVWGRCSAVCPLCHSGRARRCWGEDGGAGESMEEWNMWKNRRDGEQGSMGRGIGEGMEEPGNRWRAWGMGGEARKLLEEQNGWRSKGADGDGEQV